ncbi:MAG: hypothetical protein ACRC5A_03310 [Enterobacteriaceae bacterium]
MMLARTRRQQRDARLLGRLSALKGRKEEKFRRQMVALQDKRQELINQWEALNVKRGELQKRIRDYRLTKSILTLTELAQYRARIIRWHNQDKSLADLQDELKEKQAVLEQEIEQVRKAMLRVIRSQEKLQAVIHEYSKTTGRG